MKNEQPIIRKKVIKLYWDFYVCLNINTPKKIAFFLCCCFSAKRQRKKKGRKEKKRKEKKRKEKKRKEKKRKEKKERKKERKKEMDINLPPIGLVEEKRKEFENHSPCLVATETDYCFYTCLGDADRSSLSPSLLFSFHLFSPLFSKGMGVCLQSPPNDSFQPPHPVPKRQSQHYSHYHNSTLSPFFSNKRTSSWAIQVCESKRNREMGWPPFCP